jgi:hypothetical protein
MLCCRIMFILKHRALVARLWLCGSMPLTPVPPPCPLPPLVPCPICMDVNRCLA